MVRKVKVKTNQPETKVLEDKPGLLKVAVKASPKQGKANKELINFLSKKYNSYVEIIRGKKSKKKLIKFLSED